MKGVLTPTRYLRLWAVWLCVALVVYFLCIMTGQGPPGSSRIEFHWPGHNLYEARWPRVLAAGIVGMALAGAGITLQALLRNPLADPYVLGISSGSALGVMLWLLLISVLPATLLAQLPSSLLATGRSIPAVGGAIGACMLVFFLAKSRHRTGAIDPLSLLLVGVVVSSMNAALLMVLNALAPHGVREDIGSYLLGWISENDLSHANLGVAALILLIGYIPALLIAPALNIGSLSDLEATSLGINVRRLRTRCFICASIMTGAALLLAGPIGFVGLICPHICRRLIGADHRKLMVAAPLCGAAFLMAADTAVRSAVAFNYGQFPVGVVTALCGGPFFLLILRRGRGAAGVA